MLVLVCFVHHRCWQCLTSWGEETASETSAAFPGHAGRLRHPPFTTSARNSRRGCGRVGFTSPRARSSRKSRKYTTSVVIPVRWALSTAPTLSERLHPSRNEPSTKAKRGYTSVVVEATCDHVGRIIAATKSYPGAENDKTVIARDESIWRIRDEEPWKSYPYKLRNADGTETDYTGAWLIVDGGYPKASRVQ